MWNSVKKALLLAVAMTALIGSAAHADIINVTVAADTYVVNASGAATAGGSYSLSAYNQPGTFTYQNYVYLKFDLSAVPVNTGITNVTLNLAGIGGYGAAPVTPTSVYYVADDSWSESTMTWNTKKTFSSLLGYITTTTYKGFVDNPFWYQWTLAVTPDMLTDGILSLAVLENGGPEAHQFASKEFATVIGTPGFAPYLGVTYTAAPVPLPPSALLLGTGLLGLVGLRRLRRS
jgi:hypothetical protein